MDYMNFSFVGPGKGYNFMSVCLVHLLLDVRCDLRLKLCIYVIQLHFNHIIVTIETGELILYICLSRDLKVINVSM